MHPPCCQTPQLSHWTKKLPVSSVRFSAFGCCCRRASEGPGYSACPQIQRVTSSSVASISFSSSLAGSWATDSLSSPLRRLRRGAICSALKESAPSADSEGGVDEGRGEFARWGARLSRSGFEVEEALEFVWLGPGGACCEERARDERRGLIVEILRRCNVDRVEYVLWLVTGLGNRRKSISEAVVVKR